MPCVSARLWCRNVSDQPPVILPAPARTSTLFCRAGYAYKDWAEASLTVYNLGHDLHRETTRGQELGTQILVKTTLKF